MADNQVKILSYLSIKDHSKNKKTYSWIVKNFLLKRLLQELDILKTLGLDLKHQSKPLNQLTLIKNVHSLVTSQSEVKFLKEFVFQQKCKELLLSEEIIFIMFLNIIDMKKDIETFQFIVLQLSQLKKEILLLLVNVDHSVKQFTLMFLKLFQTKLLVMSENNSCFFDS